MGENNKMVSLADLVQAFPQLRQRLIESSLNDPEPAGYINNPVRAPMVQGGIALRSLFNMDPTDQQRLEDAFSQFPARQYGRR